jgi:N-dimethylarginine dimethylaminohydrolase
MFSVYQHWDPLKVCIVGRSYPPEFYSWIKISHVRSLFEKIAIETEEDYQNIIAKLESFGVSVLRPDLLDDPTVEGTEKFHPPPMNPRDVTVMIGQKLYIQSPGSLFEEFYQAVKDPSWPDCNNLDDFKKLPVFIQEECIDMHRMHECLTPTTKSYARIVDYVKKQTNTVEPGTRLINGAQVTRIGKDLYFGTPLHTRPSSQLQSKIDSKFTDTRNHIIHTNGHSDGCFCPVAPGLIVSLVDISNYKDTFPGWEVVYVPHQSWEKVQPFLNLKVKNQGKWWIPGFEADHNVVDVVETWLSHWVGFVEETVFDVNMLVVDPKNVLVFNYNKQVFDALDRYGITPHIVPFRHRYFWDGGIHCVTSDLDRRGTMQNYFPDRG